jgi:hypothetical protein
MKPDAQLSRVIRVGIIVTAAMASHTLSPAPVKAQPATNACRPPQVIPLTATEPPARLVVDAPLAEPLASRGVVVIPYCAEHMRLAPVFGPGGLTVSPRVGHVHVTVDASPWLWADASGTPVILQGLPPGPHTVLIELVNANLQVVDKSTVRFDVPSKPVSHPPHRDTVEGCHENREGPRSPDRL